MKKTKTIDTYYCDYCGNECEHTPDYILPEERIHSSPYHNLWGDSLGDNLQKLIIPAQKDICPKCQRKMISAISFVKTMEIDEDDLPPLSITF